MFQTDTEPSSTVKNGLISKLLASYLTFYISWVSDSNFSTFVSAFQLIVPVFLIFQYLINLVPGRSRVPSGRFSSRKAAVMAGTTRGQGRFGRLDRK